MIVMSKSRSEDNFRKSVLTSASINTKNNILSGHDHVCNFMPQFRCRTDGPLCAISCHGFVFGRADRPWAGNPPCGPALQTPIAVLRSHGLFQTECAPHCVRESCVRARGAVLRIPRGFSYTHKTRRLVFMSMVALVILHYAQRWEKHISDGFLLLSFP